MHLRHAAACTPLLLYLSVQADELLGPAVTYPTDLGPTWVEPADLDGDGHADVVVANEDAGTIALLLGSGQGDLTTGASIALGGAPACVRAVDLTADGLLDLAVADRTGSRIVLLYNRGARVFEAGTSYALDRPLRLVAADLDHDGDMDLAANAWRDVHGPHVFLNRGGRAYDHVPGIDLGRPVDALWAGDLDGDGRVESVVTERYGPQITVLSMTSEGEFRVVQQYDGGRPLDSASGLRNMHVDATDLDDDGFLDLIAAGLGRPGVMIWPGLGDGTFDQAALRQLALEDRVLGVSARDLDLDGRLDLAWLVLGRARMGTVEVWRGVATPEPQRASARPVGRMIPGPGSTLLYRSRLVTVDLDGDGDHDLIGARRADGCAFALYNQTVRSVDIAPVARATGPGRAWSGERIQLEGGLSRDPEGTALAYRWHQVGGSPVDLEGASAGKASFFVPAGSDTLSFQLVVQDSMGAWSPPDTLVVPVLHTQYPPASRPDVLVWAQRLSVGSSIRNIEATLADPGVVYAATAGAGVQRSRSGGQTWTPANHGLSSLDVRQILAVPGQPAHAFAMVGEGRTLHESHDSGASWQPVVSDGWEVRGFHRMGFSGSRLYLIGPEGYGLRYWDPGAERVWDANRNLPTNDYGGTSEVLAWTADPHDPRIQLCVVVPWLAAFYRAHDGLDWHGIENQVPWRQWVEVQTLYVAPATSWLYLISRTRLYRSKRLGDQWEDLTDGLPESSKLLALIADPGHVPSLYAGTDQGVLWSGDGGDTWEFIAGSPEAEVTALALVAQAPRSLLVGTADGRIFTAELRDGVPTAVWESAQVSVPPHAYLGTPFPNPFNAAVTLRYELTTAGEFGFRVYDLAGQQIARIASGYRDVGSHVVAWEGTDAEGVPVASGVYLLAMQGGRARHTCRVVCVR